MKTISGKRLCSILEKHGWALKKINDSHHIYFKKGKELLIVVPVHKNDDLKIGLLKGIMKIAGLVESDLK